MKNSLILLLTILSIYSQAQVSISSDGATPHTSAMLEVKSTAKGFLPPRMNHADLAVIASPAEGLVVFCTDCGSNGTGALAMFVNGRWNTLSANCLLPYSPATAVHSATYNQVIWNWNPVSDATGYRWNTVNSFATATDMGTETTKTETSLACSTTYTRYVWAYNSCGNSTSTLLTQTTTNNPTSPVSGTHVATPSTITWNWSAVANATGYKWNTTNNYATATDMGTNTSKTESGLACNLTYFRYVWAYTNCGNSTAVTLSQSTPIAPASPVAGTHVATSASVTWNWNPVTGAAGYKWNTVNNYATATDMGTATSKTETGLNCNTAYTRYIWAYSACGNSAFTSTAQTTLSSPVPPAEGTHVPSTTQIIWKWNAVAGATGYKWSTTNNYATAINLGNVLSRTETGLVCNTPYTRYVWAYNSCSASVTATLSQSTAMSGIPASPVAGTHTSTTSAITWNWNSVAGALGYKWNTTNDYSTATDMGTALTKTESGLTCATTYTRYVWAYTACGVSTPVTLTKATIYCLWICGMPLTDSRDGKIYSTVFIGTQCWMAENLNVGVQLATFIPCSNNGMIEKYCFSGLPSNCTEYGGLYVWDEMMNYTTSSNTNPSNRQGVCPTGWHIPSDAEWCEMESFLDANVVCPETGWIGVDVGGQLKEAGTVHWTTPNTGATNASGFTALPGGYTWDNNSGNGYKGTKAYFSSATEISTTLLSGRGLHYDSKQSTQLDLDKTFGLSVRCVKN